MKTIRFGAVLSGMVIAVLAGNSLAASRCVDLSACERKFCEIERQLEQAQRANQQQKVDGLRRALANAKANCSDHQLRRELLDDIEETQAEIADHWQDLHQAEQDGDAAKIIKYRDKLEAKQQELESLLQQRATGE